MTKSRLSAVELRTLDQSVVIPVENDRLQEIALATPMPGNGRQQFNQASRDLIRAIDASQENNDEEWIDHDPELDSLGSEFQRASPEPEHFYIGDD